VPVLVRFFLSFEAPEILKFQALWLRGAFFHRHRQPPSSRTVVSNDDVKANAPLPIHSEDLLAVLAEAQASVKQARRS
jgi:hypothetical protein